MLLHEPIFRLFSLGLRGISRFLQSRPEGAVGEIGGDASLPSSACLSFFLSLHREIRELVFIYKGEIGILPLMVRLLIDTYRTAENQPGRLRGELTSQEIKKYVAICLKPGKSTGPDRCPNELTKAMTDEEFQIVKMSVNEILTEDTSRQRETMNSNISQLHKGGITNKLSDQRPVVLLNSVYELLNYVINEQLKKWSNQLAS